MTNLYNEKMKSRLQKAEQKNADMKEYLAYVDTLAEKSKACCVVDSKYYEQYDVKRGLREENGKGVLVGLTNISEIKAKIPSRRAYFPTLLVCKNPSTSRKQ